MPDPEKLKKWNLKPYVPKNPPSAAVVEALEYSRKWDEVVRRFWEKQKAQGRTVPEEYQ